MQTGPMRFAATLVALSLSLSACAPMALFANGSGSEYRGYHTNLGVYVASRQVSTFCLSPALRLALWDIEGYFGKKVVLDSGYRTPWHNAEVGGAASSYHMKCMAADIFIPGVPKSRLIAFAKREGLIGGLGCYPGRGFIHVDVRDRPRGATGPVTFAGC